MIIFLKFCSFFNISHPPATKCNMFERSGTNFNQVELVINYCDKDWGEILNLKHSNVNVSMENFVNNMNDLLDKHLLLYLNGFLCRLKFRT